MTYKHLSPSATNVVPVYDPVDEAFCGEVMAAFAARPRTISPRWLYDHRGSELFEEITRLPEYYLGRAEHEILTAHAGEIAVIAGAGRAIIEFGSGSSSKTGALLRALEPSAYVPVDISAQFLNDSGAALTGAFPSLPIHPIAADFTHPLMMPIGTASLARLGYFAGSTIGNMTPPEAVDFLRAASVTLGKDSLMLVGIDRIKDSGRLLPAYDDAAGVTARFNLTLLDRINRDLGGDIPLEAFVHRARWNDLDARIEMHIEALQDIRFSIAERHFSMSAGETLHTENSHKYGARDARLLMHAGGWSPIAEWTDREGLFALLLATPSSLGR